MSIQSTSSCSTPSAMSINVEDHECVIAFFRKAFSDYFEFSTDIEPVMRELLQTIIIQDSSHIRERLKSVASPADSRNGEDAKKRQERSRIALTAFHLFLLAMSSESYDCLCNSIDELLEMYPHFSEVNDQKELDRLLVFRNFMTVALSALSPKNNKIFLLKVIERLEGSDEEYITGTGQKPAVTRRISIYEKEGNVTAKTYARPPMSNTGSVRKRTKVDESATKHKISNEQSIDDLFDNPPVLISAGTLPKKFPPFVLPGPHSSLTSVGSKLVVQYSDVVQGERMIDSETHGTLLNEPYTGSFTEDIKASVGHSETKLEVQFSDVVQGSNIVGNDLHSQLLNEPYTGSFTEEITKCAVKS